MHKPKKPKPILTWRPPPGAREWLAAVLTEFVEKSTAELERTPFAEREFVRDDSVYVAMFVGMLQARAKGSDELGNALLAVLGSRTPSEMAAMVAPAEARSDETNAARLLTEIVDRRARIDEPDSERTQRADYDQEQAKDRRVRGEEFGS